MLEWLKEHKGIVSIICTVIGAAIAVLQALQPISKLAIDTNSRISVIEEIARENKKDIEEHNDYIRDSERARGEAMVGIATIIEQTKGLKEDVAALKKYDQEQLRIIEKFYKLNPQIKNPRFSYTPLTIHQVHEYELLKQGGSN